MKTNSDRITSLFVVTIICLTAYCSVREIVKACVTVEAIHYRKIDPYKK